MTKDEHKAEHLRLHRALDQLMADFLAHQWKKRGAKMKLPNQIMLRELMDWSFRQTQEPEEL